jgi:hypothetical protein
MTDEDLGSLQLRSHPISKLLPLGKVLVTSTVKPFAEAVSQTLPSGKSCARISTGSTSVRI